MYKSNTELLNERIDLWTRQAEDVTLRLSNYDLAEVTKFRNTYNECLANLSAENISQFKELQKNELNRAMDLLNELDDLNVNITADWQMKRPDGDYRSYVQVEIYHQKGHITVYRKHR